MPGDLFRPVPAWDMEEAKRFMRSHPADAYELIDVRQPEEFAQGHLPGANLIPLTELPARLGEIERERPVLVYCRSGGRAGNATAFLLEAGFAQARNIGGILQWQGLTATGAPEAGTAVFDPARRPGEYVAVAWALEEGARIFYLDLSERFPDLRGMFAGMAAGEAHHRDLLAGLHRKLTGTEPEPAPGGAAGMMEGGIDRREATVWVRNQDAVDVLEFVAVMEANAHDRYIRIGRGVGGETQRAFQDLAEAEKSHLDLLLQAFQERLRAGEPPRP